MKRLNVLLLLVKWLFIGLYIKSGPDSEVSKAALNIKVVFECGDLFHKGMGLIINVKCYPIQSTAPPTPQLIPLTFSLINRWRGEKRKVKI